MRVAKTYNSDLCEMVWQCMATYTSFWGPSFVSWPVEASPVNQVPWHHGAPAGETSRTRAGSAHLGAAGSAGIAGHGAGVATTGRASNTTRLQQKS